MNGEDSESKYQVSGSIPTIDGDLSKLIFIMQICNMVTALHFGDFDIKKFHNELVRA